MSKLFPIIRRQRRPLVVEPLPPVKKEPVTPEVEIPPVKPADNSQSGDANEISSTDPA
jgi:hypothetical protein